MNNYSIDYVSTEICLVKLPLSGSPSIGIRVGLWVIDYSVIFFVSCTLIIESGMKLQMSLSTSFFFNAAKKDDIRDMVIFKWIQFLILQLYPSIYRRLELVYLLGNIKNSAIKMNRIFLDYKDRLGSFPDSSFSLVWPLVLAWVI